jgi:lipid-binding SYLF domain-containing protein
MLKLKEKVFLGVAMLAALTLLWGGVATASEQENTVNQAIAVLDKIMEIPESAIPPNLLSNAYGIAIIPGVIKGAFILGGRYGEGVMLVRDSGGGWSNPTFLSIGGGSLGWQIGGQSTDVILVFKSQSSIENIKKGKFTLGADAAVAAGPVGRRVEGATDVMLQAEILSYSRSRGFFAGVSLEGSVLQILWQDNTAYYGRDSVTVEDIFAGRVSAPASAETLRSTLDKYAL